MKDATYNQKNDLVRNLLEVVAIILLFVCAFVFAALLQNQYLTLVCFLGLLGLVSWIVKVRYDGWRTFGLKRPRSWTKTIIIALSLFISYQIIENIALNALPQGNFDKNVSSAQQFDFVKNDTLALIFWLFVSWTWSSFGEEMIFRGFLLNRISSIFGGTKFALAASLVISSIIFASLHFWQGPFVIIRTGIWGLAAGIAYLINDRNLWVPILWHGFSNTFAFLLIYKMPA